MRPLVTLIWVESRSLTGPTVPTNLDAVGSPPELKVAPCVAANGDVTVSVRVRAVDESLECAASECLLHYDESVLFEKDRPSASELPAPEWAGPAWARLKQQIAFYDSESLRAMGYYKTIKVMQLIAAATVPVVAGVGVSGWITGALGSGIVVMEGVQQLYKFHDYWLSYRATCEGLRQEQFLFEAKASSYRSAPDPDGLLAEHLAQITSQELARWTSLHADNKEGTK